MTRIVGTTNTDGTGSAANLNVNNGQEISSSNSAPYVSYEEDNYFYSSLSIENTTEWNADGLKEISITDLNGVEETTINNFVDVYITAHTDLTSSDDGEWSSLFSDISIYNAKRGYIDTTSADDSTSYDDYITISPISNGSSWSNLFEIQTGSGQDQVQFESTDGSTQYTEFDVDLGDDSDLFDYGLEAAASQSQTRHVDGGNGDDFLYLSSDAVDLDFENFEVVFGQDDRSLTLDQDILAKNDGLLIDKVAIDIADDYDTVSVTALSDDQISYIDQLSDSNPWTYLSSDEYYAVTVTYDAEEYTILTNDIDSDWLVSA